MPRKFDFDELTDAFLIPPVKRSAKVVVIATGSPSDGVIVNVPPASLVMPAAPTTEYVVAPSGPLGGRPPPLKESRNISVPSLIIQNSSKTGVKGTANAPDVDATHSTIATTGSERMS
jgi:hypothetical protein